MNVSVKIIITVAGLMLVAETVLAQTTNSYAGGTANFNGGDLSGANSALPVSGSSGTIESVTVSLNIADGYNGSLYAYLLGPTGTKAILLNRVGVGASDSFGYADTGFNITLADSAGAVNVHDYGAGNYAVNGSGQVLGTWASDGRAIDPQSAPGAFNAASTASNLNLFTGETANGTWKLFIADVVAGDDNGMLNGWNLTIVTTPVPESSALVLNVLGGVIFFGLARRRS